jgi:hypothetical protein
VKLRKRDYWTRLNQAMKDGSLYTAKLWLLRHYLDPAIEHRAPYLAETIRKLISQRESSKQTRWTVIGVVVGSALGVLTLMLSALGALKWR